MVTSFVSTSRPVVGLDADLVSAQRMIVRPGGSSSGMTRLVPKDDDRHETRR